MVHCRSFHNISLFCLNFLEKGDRRVAEKQGQNGEEKSKRRYCTVHSCTYIYIQICHFTFLLCYVSSHVDSGFSLNRNIILLFQRPSWGRRGKREACAPMISWHHLTQYQHQEKQQQHQHQQVWEENWTNRGNSGYSHNHKHTRSYFHTGGPSSHCTIMADCSYCNWKWLFFADLLFAIPCPGDP